MALKKEKKKEVVKKAEDILNKGKSFVFVNFNGLTVSDSSSMRKELRGKEVGFYVLKKTLLKMALGGKKDVKGDIPDLPGEIAIAYGEDLISPAREVFSFEKKLKEAVKIAGGIFDGEYVGREKMLSIATIPPTQVLYCQFVNLINSPIQRLVVSLDQIAKKKN